MYSLVLLLAMCPLVCTSVSCVSFTGISCVCLPTAMGGLRWKLNVAMTAFLVPGYVSS